MYEYKVVVYMEDLLGSIILGESKVDPVQFTKFLNELASDGWEVVAIEKEIRRALLFFDREAYVVILKRPIT